MIFYFQPHHGVQVASSGEVCFIQIWGWILNLGGGFKYVLFSSLFGEDDPI